MQKFVNITKYLENFEDANQGSISNLGTALACVPLKIELLEIESLVGDFDDQAAVAHLLSRAWFTRAWVAQEISLNKQVNIFCGRKSILWYDLVSFWIFKAELSRISGLGVNFWEQADLSWESLIQMRGEARKQGGSPLIQVLHKLRVFHCQEGQDKLYAALGLASDLPVGTIKPDYSKSVVEVYMDVVRYCLGRNAADHRLDFLGMVIRPAHDAELLHHGAFSYYVGAEDEATPTWVPDWRISLSFVHLPKTFGVGDLADAKVYDASKGSDADINIVDRKLLVRGISADCITSVSSIFESDDRHMAVQRSWRPNNLDDEYATGETVNKAFLCTLVADARWITASKVMHRGYSVDWTALERVSNRTNMMKLEPMLSSVFLATGFHRFIRTKKGYMGLAPAAAAIGDKICVLFGGHVLYVLRDNKDSKTHEFMGECYVHGLMDGQALDMPTNNNEAKPVPEVFVLV